MRAIRLLLHLGTVAHAGMPPHTFERFPMEFYASCPEGFESALADELRSLGTPRVRKLKGRVSFEGEPLNAERVCLWSRLASRVLVVVGRFGCRDARDLYDGTYDIAWEDILRRGSTIAVSARGTNDELRNTRYASLCVKDAICDRLADETGARADVDTEHPDAHVTLTLRGERASIQLDLSGDALFRRLPRDATRAGGAHVLRPDYAALALAQAKWADACHTAADTNAPCVLIDACCAGGGIVLEAASIAAGRAPGARREFWGFTSWAAHDPIAWTKLLADARAHECRCGAIRIVATDSDQQAVALARRILKSAHLDQQVIFTQANADKLLSKLGLNRHDAIAPALAGTIVADTTDIALSRMSRTLTLLQDLRDAPETAALPLVALERTDLLERTLGEDAIAHIRIRPNNDPARLLVFGAEATGDAAAVPSPAGDGARDDDASATPRATVDVGDGSPIPVLIPESDQFAARLKKVARLRRKWAKRTGVTCYRVYDADLPDYAAAIDLYEGSAATPGRWLVIAEYAAPRSVDPELAQARLLDMLAIAPRVLGVEPDHVAARSRTRSRGGSQYAGAGSRNRGGASTDASSPLIQEGGLTFSVNFNDYLDTGIFLDHRVTRDLVRQRAQGCQRFLNLFAYTGTATCYAADGGAERTTTVDLSNTYLDWARRNMELNGFTGRAHEFVRADVLAWIDDARRAHRSWDLIFCDPPTFSNSSKMGERTWDVQRDHVWLLTCLADLLTPGGLAIFSCNLRTFKPALDELAAAGVSVEDITAETIPEDFSRNGKIHHCYLVRRA